jgi:DNA-binding response OmpR family regulator
MRRRDKTALLVDDHPEIRNQIREILGRLGFETVEASDAASAFDRLATCRPDMICLDLVLPDSSGYDICEFIRKSPEHSATPVLMMSDRSYPEDRAHAAEAGADAFLAKPFTEKMLRERVEALLPKKERAVGS